jgi:hypothetical protein
MQEEQTDWKAGAWSIHSKMEINGPKRRIIDGRAEGTQGIDYSFAA